MVVIVEPNGDESRVICRLQGAITEIDFADGQQPEYFHQRYGGPSSFSSLVRRAALGLNRREDTELVTTVRLKRADFVLQRTTEAFEYARKLHGGQVRKGSGAPYISHLLAVAALVLENGGDEDETIAALLHDAPEDAGGVPVLDEIRRIFGQRVAAIVEACCDSMEDPKPEWRTRKENHLAHLVTADGSVLLVLAADKLHNTMTIVEDRKLLGETIWSRFKGGREGTLWYLAAVAQAIQKHPESPPGARRMAERIAGLLDKEDRGNEGE
jgi:GTP pyrophosphokinase